MEWFAIDPVIPLAGLVTIVILFSLNWFFAPSLIEQVVAKRRRVRAKRKAAAACIDAPRRRPSPHPQPQPSAPPAAPESQPAA